MGFLKCPFGTEGSKIQTPFSRASVQTLLLSLC